MSDTPDEPEEDMTPAQIEAVQKAWSILGEHFDRVLLVIDYDVDTGSERAQAHEIYWHGGALAAVGMAEFAKDRLLRKDNVLKSNDPGDTE